MNLFDIITIAMGLAMDCLAVSIACGIIINRFAPVSYFKIAFFFGLFQGVMPLIGWLAGSRFKDEITFIDHWIAFVILLLLGIKMIHEHFEKKDEKCGKRKLNPYKLTVILTLALATSIDALAIGVTFAFLDSEPFTPSLIIGIITFLISLFGLYFGSKYSCRFKVPAELMGGLVLIGIGTKILIEHLYF